VPKSSPNYDEGIS